MGNQFQKLEETLDLPSMDEVSETSSNIQPTQEDINTALARANDLEKEVGKIDGFDQHDGEMDELANMAIEAHKDLQELGMSVEIRHAGEIFSSSSQMLKIAVDAKNLKVEKKLRLLRLQLDKLRIDRMNSDSNAGVLDGSVQKIDRNDLINMLKNTKPDDK